MTPQRDVETLAAAWRRLARAGRAGKVGDWCIVRSKRHGNEQPDCKIHDKSNEGCQIKFPDGHVAFIRWNELYPPDGWGQSPKPAAPLATLGDVVPRPQLARPAPSSPPPPDSAPRRRRQSAPRQRQAHTATAIGNLFRAARLRLKFSQREIGDRIGCTDQVVSAVELGDKLPTDDQLLGFAELTKIDLSQLLLARDGVVPTAMAPTEPPPAIEPQPDPIDEQPPQDADQDLIRFGMFLATFADAAGWPDGGADTSARERWARGALRVYRAGHR